jgi:protein-S-isoprenylcysteine O-methyltransferase Ste14
MNEEISQDKAGIRIPPPLLFVAALGMGLALHFAVPLLFDLSMTIRTALAVVVSLASGVMAVAAFVTMHQHRTPFNPDKPTRAICCKGVFQITRNPLYLALVLLLLGTGVILSSLWLLFLTPVLLIFLDWLAVRPEEIYLARKFGDDYLEYKRTVRRWL